MSVFQAIFRCAAQPSALLWVPIHSWPRPTHVQTQGVHISMRREMKCQALRKKLQTKKEMNEPSQCLFTEMLELCVFPSGDTRKFLHQLLCDRAQAELILHLPPGLGLGCILCCHNEKCCNDSKHNGTNKNLEHNLPAVGFVHFSFLFPEVFVGCGIPE